MFKKFALTISALALPLYGLAAGTEQPAAPAQVKRAAPAASGASAPVAKRKASNANFNQRNSTCQKKATDAGLTGDARKKAVLDCVKTS
jgi:curli biogenesis system outer membrane secretion channel CsgG